jgi:hypothetical protein
MSRYIPGRRTGTSKAYVGTSLAIGLALSVVSVYVGEPSSSAGRVKDFHISISSIPALEQKQPPIR